MDKKQRITSFKELLKAVKKLGIKIKPFDFDGICEYSFGIGKESFNLTKYGDCEGGYIMKEDYGEGVCESQDPQLIYEVAKALKNCEIKK